MIGKQRKSLPSGLIVGGAAADAAAPGLPRALGWKQQHQLVGLLFLLPALVFVAVFYVYPIALNIVMSFERYTAKSFVTGEAPFIGFSNFVRLFSNPDFTVAVQNTLVFTLGSLLFQFVIGLALAVFFKQKFPLSGLLRSLFLLPWLAPILVSGAIWVRLFDLDYGVINFVLHSLGLIQQPLAFVTGPHLGPISVLIAKIWISIPFNILVLLGWRHSNSQHPLD